VDAPEDAQLMAALEKDEAYRVERVLASGEAGSTEVVSRPGAEHLGEGPLVRKRIKRDVANAEVFSRLSSVGGAHLPHVVETYDLPDQVAIVREYVYGASLAACVAEAGRMGETAAARVVADVCDAVAALHGQGIVHRDVSPKNVILSPRGAILIDLGIARAYVEGAQRDTTRLGTWGFASPEQYGFAQTDGRSDVYSVGCLLGYMLTGVTPDAEGYAAALADTAVVRPELRRIVEKACSFEPSERYQSAGALRDAVLQAVPDAASVNDSKAPSAKASMRGKIPRTLARPGQLVAAFSEAKPWMQVLIVALVVLGAFTGILFGSAAVYATNAMVGDHPVESLLVLLGVTVYLALLMVEELPAAMLGAGPYAAMKYRRRSARASLLGKRLLLGLAALAVFIAVLAMCVALTPGG
jgi:predicted Ser/Thr protein kinase